MLQSLKGPTEKGRFQRVAWTDLNRTLISAGEDGCVRRWDVEVGRWVAVGVRVRVGARVRVRAAAVLPCADPSANGLL